jgi:hypothetical protein
MDPARSLRYPRDDWGSRTASGRRHRPSECLTPDACPAPRLDAVPLETTEPEISSRLGEGRQPDELQQLFAARLRHLIQVQEPLVLISQIQRSGGSLLSQLFDAHPECHAHPSELGIGYPRRSNWPQLALDAGPDRWFEILGEQKPAKHLRRGYRKGGFGSEPDVFPFLFLPTLQRAIFAECVSLRQIERERDVFDCYFTSYFNAWLDNHNLETGPKKVVTAFVPRLSTDAGSLERFFGAYSDGTLISIVRDPCAWYASARTTRSQFSDPDRGIELWRRSAAAGLEARDRFGDRVILLTYEELVLETRRTMSQIADRLGITMSPVLLEPTFNRRRIRANSSVSVHRHGILRERANVGGEALDPGTIARIREVAGDLYDQVLAVSTLA